MIPALFDLPPAFWFSLMLLAGVTAYAWAHRHQGWGIPAMAVCGTVFVWYHGDALYNDYFEYSRQFSRPVLDAAWWQVAGFLGVFACFAPLISACLTRENASQGSVVMSWVESRHSLQRIQPILGPTLKLLAMVWIVLTLVALVRTGFDFQGLFAPWLGRRANPWARGRIGGGADFLFSLASYVNIFCLAGFGVVAALANRRRLQMHAVTLVALSWPYVLIDRTRNTMLAIVLPGLLCLAFLRLRRQPWLQVCLLGLAFLALHTWFGFVLHQRSSQSVAAAVSRGRFRETGDVHHLGLNMYEELCWVNQFFREGTYEPSWGHRYFAEAVNFVPRTIWPNKPTIGLDYSIARGQGTGRGADDVHATISTGMIGQGVVNFGTWLGPAAAALLMAIWVGVLAKLDLAGHDMGYLPLYLLGLTLTFNLGRDITLLVAYPLVFGILIVWLFERFTGTRISIDRMSGVGRRYPFRVKKAIHGNNRLRTSSSRC